MNTRTADKSTETSTTVSFLTALRDELRARRAEAAARRKLERELSTYTTPSDLADLNAMLDRYDGPEVDEVRRALDRVRTHQAA